MPTQTFLDLSNQKRDNLTNLAIAEFARHDYSSASISKIVAQAKIAKGSLYQYFQDKKDLYLYLVELVNQTKIDYLKHADPPVEGMNFFDYLGWLFRVSARFDFEHPALSQLIYRSQYGSVPFREEVLQQSTKASLNYIHQLVERGIAQGDINADIAPDFAAYMINTLANGLGGYILERLEIAPQRLAEEGPIQEIDMAAINQIFDELIQVLKHGLGRVAPATSVEVASKRRAASTTKT